MNVCIAPNPWTGLHDAVLRGGATLSEAADADAIVWTDYRSPDALGRTLEVSPARWVQLPFAGIEGFVEAGVLDPARTWTCAKGIYGPATAEHALALVLMAARRLDRHAREAHWQTAEDFGDRRLHGTTAIVVGTGGIGRTFATMAAPIGIHVIAVNRSGTPMPGAERTVIDLAEVVGLGDWIILAAAATPETRHLLDAAMIGGMRRDAWVINVARGSLVDTDALVAALREHHIGGAALDVTEPEPLPADHPLWSLDNAVITSHKANTLAMALPELAALVERNVAAFIAGRSLEGIVDVALGY